MAFTNSQRNAIRMYLGGPLYGTQVDPAVDNAINAVESLADVDLEARIIAVLASLESLDAQLLEARTRFKFRRVEDVEFNVGGEVGNIAQLGTVFVERLATLLGCPVRKNPYRGSGNGALMRHG